MSKLLATWFYVGLLKPAPGTFGSLAGMLMAYGILQLPYGWMLLFGAAIVLTWLGAGVSRRYMETQKTEHDASEIVIDEVAGQWLTYSIFYTWLVVMTGANYASVALLDSVALEIPFLLLGFVFFRLFDIVKPWPISLADRHIKGGFGVMFDDVLAAFAAGTLLYASYVVWPIFTGEAGIEMP